MPSRMPPSAAQSRVRKYDLIKSRAGCLTCKIRKVKCDEQKPHCVRCTSTGRKCEYETPNRSQRGTPLPSVSTALSQFSSIANAGALRERRAFEYYFHQGAPAIAGALDIHFWKGLVLQLSRSQPAIWDAVISIGSLHEKPSHLPRTGMEVAQHNEALSWYSRSMTSVRNAIEQNRANKDVALITCVLYICIEIMQGHMQEALQLYEQGVRLISDLRAIGTYRTSCLENTIIPLFFRISIDALSSVGTPVIREFCLLAGGKELSAFSNVEEARASLSILIRDTITFAWEAEGHLINAQYPENISPGFVSNQKNILHRLEEWKRSFTRLKNADTRIHTDPLYHSAILTLEVLYESDYIVLATCLSQLESSYDEHIKRFKLVVEHASQALSIGIPVDGSRASFTFESGVGKPLFFVAMRCRDFPLRRKALSLLRQVPQVQGFFQCSLWASRAEQFIRMEEENLPGLMIRASDLDTSTPPIPPDQTPMAIPSRVEEISMDRIANLPAVEELVTIEDNAKGKPFVSAGRYPIPEECRIRKLVPVQLNNYGDALFSGVDGAVSNLQSQSHPFAHFTINKPDLVKGMWKETEFFIPLSPMPTSPGS